MRNSANLNKDSVSHKNVLIEHLRQGRIFRISFRDRQTYKYINIYGPINLILEGVKLGGDEGGGQEA